MSSQQWTPSICSPIKIQIIQIRPGSLMFRILIFTSTEEIGGNTILICQRKYYIDLSVEIFGKTIELGRSPTHTHAHTSKIKLRWICKTGVKGKEAIKDGMLPTTVVLRLFQSMPPDGAKDPKTHIVPIFQVGVGEGALNDKGCWTTKFRRGYIYVCFDNWALDNINFNPVLLPEHVGRLQRGLHWHHCILQA